MRRATILVVDDDERLRDTLGILARNLGHEAVAAADVAGAQRVLVERAVDLVISDLRMPGGSGLDLLDIVRRGDAHTPVIMLTAYGTVETAVEAMKNGAFDYLVKPFDAAEMELRIERALTLQRFRLESDYLREEIETRGGLDELIGVSEGMRRVFDLVQQVAPSKASVLVTGETGTGKELLARAIHRRSPREAHLLVPVNLAAVPAELLESELFGHARGAFTGAVAERPGSSSSRTGARSSWTRSATFRSRFSRRSSASCRMAWWSGWAATSGGRWTCASWPPRTAISPRRWPRNGFVPICTTGSASSRSACPRSGSGARTSAT